MPAPLTAMPCIKSTGTTHTEASPAPISGIASFFAARRTARRKTDSGFCSSHS